jgi:glycine dehydrogenase
MQDHYDFTFERRHNGPGEPEIRTMLDAIGYDSLDELVDTAIPESIRYRASLRIGAGTSEHEALRELREVATRNRVMRSYIGMGYHDTSTPPVIQRKVLENPAWYTAYTPYQAEIAQGRLEALLTFQTVVIDLTGLPIANASLLDEGTAAAESMAMCEAVRGRGRSRFFVSELCHPQTIDVVRTRARARGWDVVVGDHFSFEFTDEFFGALLQYPATDGAVHDYREFIERAHASNALVTVAADLLALTLLVPPGEFGADVVVGNSQRFGVPLGFDGAADARAAHPPREGDQQHLHCAGAARRDRGVLCRVPWPGRAAAHCKAGAPPRPDAGGGPAPDGVRRRRGAVLRHGPGPRR